MSTLQRLSTTQSGFERIREDGLLYVDKTKQIKLAKVSVFSGMNNVDDLSLMPDLNDVVGLTQEEEENNFMDYLETLGKRFNFPSHAALMEAVKHWYNGYTWNGRERI